jgi:hypothetical protein
VGGGTTNGDVSGLGGRVGGGGRASAMGVMVCVCPRLGRLGGLGAGTSGGGVGDIPVGGVGNMLVAGVDDVLVGGVDVLVERLDIAGELHRLPCTAGWSVLSAR